MIVEEYFVLKIKKDEIWLNFAINCDKIKEIAIKIFFLKIKGE